ncbi:MAG: hypothetical protein U0X75_01275 [Acidobacteriota bacterium]
MRRLVDAAIRAEIRQRDGNCVPVGKNWFGHVGHTADRVVIAGIADLAYAAHNGKSLGEIARAVKQDPWDVFFALARTGASARRKA